MGSAEGDTANAVLAAAGYNFRRLLAWLAAAQRLLIMAALVGAEDGPILVLDGGASASESQSYLANANAAFFTADPTAALMRLRRNSSAAPGQKAPSRRLEPNRQSNCGYRPFGWS